MFLIIIYLIPDILALRKRKVKAVSPSPFYDGTYHPPLIGQRNAALYIEIYYKVEKFFNYMMILTAKLCTPGAHS
jgi:hypothetical protein